MKETLNFIPQLTLPRIRTLLKNLEPQRFNVIGELSAKRGSLNNPPAKLAQVDPEHFVSIEKGDYFAPRSKKDSNLDFSEDEDLDEFVWGNIWFELQIPEAKENERGRRILFWDSPGETTVYLDGQPWAGIDPGHHYCPLPDQAATLYLDTGTYSTAIWHDTAKQFEPDEYGFRFNGVRMAMRNEEMIQLYHRLNTLFQLVASIINSSAATDANDFSLQPAVDDCPPVARQLLRELHRAANCYESGGIEACNRFLDEVYKKYPAETWQPTFGISAHSHLDLVWLWPEEIGIRKGIHTMSTTLQLIERYPETIFLFTQPHLLVEIRDREPEMFKRMMNYVKLGRIELTGGMAVEADTLVPTGEALARCIAFGQDMFRELQGTPSTNVYLPDVFGYSACLPQIMQGCGINSFFTSKISWNPINMFPYHSFVWKGLDGTEVLTHFRVDGGYLPDQPKKLQQVSHEYRQSDVHDETLTWVGYGDGGGGIDEDFCEFFRTTENLAQVPQTKYTSVEGYFDRLNQVRDQLPRYEGELYLEFHRGVLTTQSEHKRLYRASECALQLREAAHALLGLPPLPYEEWNRTLFAQFHDAIPGSSIRQVYLELNPQLEETVETLSLKTSNDWETEAPGDDVVVFNPLLAERTAVIRLPDSDDSHTCVTVPPLCAIKLADAIQPDSPNWNVSATLLDNGLTQVVFSDKGMVRSICTGTDTVEFKEQTSFRLYHDNPAEFDAWDIDRHTLSLINEQIDHIPLSVTENGPVRATLSGQTRFGENSTLEILYRLEAGNPFLMIELNIDWQEDHQLLKFEMPTAFKGKMVRYGAPFGSVLRPQNDGNMIEEAMWEVAGSRWALITDDSQQQGLSLITQAKYGFAAKNGTLTLSLLRAPTYPDPKADRGTHSMSLALGTYNAEKNHSPALDAETLYGEMKVYQGCTPRTAGLGLEGKTSLVPAWVCPAKDGGIILRLHETLGQNGNVILNTEKQDIEADYVDLLENVSGPVRRNSEGKICIDYSAYQIVSLRLRHDLA